MTPLVILAVLVTVAALLIKRNSLVLAATVVIVGGEVLAQSEIFTTVSTIILVGCAQLLLYLGLQALWRPQIRRSERLTLFKDLALLCAVMSLSKLMGFVLIANAEMHNVFQQCVEAVLAGSTITMAFTLLLSPTEKVPLHELGRDYWNSFVRYGASHHHNHNHGE